MKINLLKEKILNFKEQKLISEEEYSTILRLSENNKNYLSNLLNIIHTNEDFVINEIIKDLNLKKADINNVQINQNIFDVLSLKTVFFYKFLPLTLNDNDLYIAYHNPFDFNIMDNIKAVTGFNIIPLIASKSDINKSLRKHFGVAAETVETLNSQNQYKNDDNDYLLTLEKNVIDSNDTDASIIKFVNQVLNEAINERATDIHIEPYEDYLNIRYRIDGILYDAPFQKDILHLHAPIISRIKILSGLNISKRKIPQDGRFKISINKNELDLRVSILPTTWGEAAVIRILMGAYDFISMDNIGLLDNHLRILKECINIPHGLILVTGPTGSGKTTTLYSFLSSLNAKDKKIITIEDPIEYLIKGITQLQVNNNVDFTFAKGLRSILRHDPDVIMVGEIRDKETAEIAIQSALTGHLVFSTLHTNDAISAITRLIDLGIEPFLLSSCLEGVIAQRLVRTLCKNCILQTTHNQKTTYKSDGCNACNFTGYKGRSAIFEIIRLDTELKNLIHGNAQQKIIKSYLEKINFQSLREHGLIKVENGITSLSEVLRVSVDYK